MQVSHIWCQQGQIWWIFLGQHLTQYTRPQENSPCINHMSDIGTDITLYDIDKKFIKEPPQYQQDKDTDTNTDTPNFEEDNYSE